MSWPVVKPPWKHVKWLTWPEKDGSPINWISSPNTKWSEHKPTPISSELDELKLEIEKLDKIGEWEILKRISNPYELVFSQSQDKRIPSSISSIKPLSRSFFKMIEILNVLDFFKRSSKKIRSAHVCEGPGGFIEALLYLSSRNMVTVEEASAMTLRPTKANIPGWKRAYNFLKTSPMVKIEYGADNTGDILVPLNQGAFLDKTRGRCNIFTADGGFDFSEHYGTQEEEVLPLLISSALIGLQTLMKGGDFVLKIFDTESKATTDFIALLSFCFESWTLYKPSLSRPCNAEKYFLGRSYKLAPGWILKTFVEIRNAYACGFKHMISIFPSLPEPVTEPVTILKKELFDQQVSALKYAITHKKEWNSNPSDKWSEIQENSIFWCRTFQIPMRILNSSSAKVNKENPIPWSQVVASHTHLRDAAQPE
jgi:23S rRNA U2552 (ribose-2'-O)-methylase RlmE/FtsJ